MSVRRRKRPKVWRERRVTKAANVEKLGEASVREMENTKIHPLSGVFIHISKTKHQSRLKELRSSV